MYSIMYYACHGVVLVLFSYFFLQTIIRSLKCWLLLDNMLRFSGCFCSCCFWCCRQGLCCFFCTFLPNEFNWCFGASEILSRWCRPLSAAFRVASCRCFCRPVASYQAAQRRCRRPDSNLSLALLAAEWASCCRRCWMPPWLSEGRCGCGDITCFANHVPHCFPDWHKLAVLVSFVGFEWFVEWVLLRWKWFVLMSVIASTDSPFTSKLWLL